MPYLHIKVGKPLNSTQVDALRRELEQLITILPGKNADNCMIHIEPDCAMYMQGAKNPCVFAELRLYKASPADKKQRPSQTPLPSSCARNTPLRTTSFI